MRKILLLLLFTISTFAGPGTFPQGDHIKQLKDKIEFKNSKTQLISNDSDDPSAVAKFGDAGSLYMRTNGELWQKQDSGTTVNWTQLFFTPLFTSGDKLVKSNGLDDIIDTGIDVIGTDSLGNIDRLEFDTAVANPTHGEGLLFYDNTENTLSYYNDDADVTINIGQENIVRARNTTGVSINDGTPVFISGSTGQTPNVSLANASFIETSITLGLWTSGTTANNSFGYVTTFGIVHGLNTAAYAEGTVLYLSTVDGVLSADLPIPPAQVYILGIVTNSHASQGKVFVRPESLTRDDSLYKNIITNFSGDAKFNPLLNKFTSGDSAIFGDSGTLSGTLTSSTTAADLISGSRVWKYTQAAGSLDDWIGFPSATVPEIINTTSVKLSYSFKYKYDGDIGDLENRVRCVDDSSLLVSTSNAEEIDPNVYRFSGEVTVPKDCNEIIVGLQVVTLNNGAILLFDNIKVSDEPREIKEIYSATNTTLYAASLTGSSSFSNVSVKYRRDGDTLHVHGSATFDSPTAAAVSISLPADLNIDTAKVKTLIDIVGKYYPVNGGSADIKTDSGALFYDNANTTRVLVTKNAATDTTFSSIGGSSIWNAGDSISFKFSVPITGWTKSTTGTVFASDISSTDIVFEGRGVTAPLGITGNVTDIRFTTVKDTNSIWDGDSALIPETGIFTLDGYVGTTTNGTFRIALYINGILKDYISNLNEQASDSRVKFQTTREFNEGEVVSIRSTASKTLVNSLSLHYINVTKSAPKVDNFIVDNIKVKTGYIKTKLSDYSSDLVGTTAWKTHPLLELEADASSFASISANQLTLKAGKYNFEVPIGAFNGATWVDFNFKDITNVADNMYLSMAYSATNATSFRDAEFTIDITVDTVYEFQTRAAVAAGSEFLGKIKIQQVLAR